MCWLTNYSFSNMTSKNVSKCSTKSFWFICIRQINDCLWKSKKTAWLVFEIPKTPTAQKHIDSRKQHQLGLKGYVHVIKVMNWNDSG